MTDADNDNPQLNLGGIIANLPAVRAARKANLTRRVHRRLIEPIELTEQDNEPRLSFQHTVFVRPACRTETPATRRACGRGGKVRHSFGYMPEKLPIRRRLDRLALLVIGELERADRPQLGRLMKRLVPGDVVITPAVDRPSRDRTDLLVVARDMQRAGPVSAHWPSRSSIPRPVLPRSSSPSSASPQS